MQIAIDVGYSHTKAVNNEQKVLIPSVVAPYRELVMADLSKNGGYTIEIRWVDGTKVKYFVGELALREGHTASFTIEREKHKHPNHDILILAAARLLGADTSTTMVAGLPVAYYRSQKDKLKRHLESLHAEVSVNGNRPERISFGKVKIYPQGAGALLVTTGLPADGLVLVVDVGQKTTDYVTIEIINGCAKPVSSLCGSVETGVFAVHEAVSQEFLLQTGAPLAAVRVAEVIAQGGCITYYAKEINLADALSKARADVARVIADQITATLGDRFAFIRKTYLAGGGAETLPLLDSLFPAAQKIPDPQWANAKGFLKTVSDTDKA